MSKFYGIKDYLLDCSVNTFKKYQPSHTKLQKELLKIMQERVKVLS